MVEAAGYSVKIPLTSSYITSDSHQWTKTPRADQIVEYSSLVGILVIGIGKANTTFLLESTYMELDCSDMAIGLIKPLDTTIFDQELYIEEGGCGTDAYKALKNETFEGWDTLNPNYSTYANYVQATWPTTLDAFVDHMYKIQT